MPGFTSKVISAFLSTLKHEYISFNAPYMYLGSTKLGVPPPKYIVLKVLSLSVKLLHFNSLYKQEKYASALPTSLGKDAKSQ